MATVKSVSVFSERPWSNGRVKRRYEVTLTDNDGQDHVVIIGPVKVLPADDGSTIADKLLNSRQESEVESSEESNDILTTVQSPKWATAKQIAKKAIRYMMRENDPAIVLQMEPLINHLRANYTAAQLRNFLDLNTAQLQKMNRRINSILSDTGTVKDQISAFKAEREEIE